MERMVNDGVNDAEVYAWIIAITFLAAVITLIGCGIYALIDFIRRRR